MKRLADTPWRMRWRLATAASRARPDFIIAGIQKGGTSTLHSWLARHPQVKRPAIKEVHYFDWEYGRGQDWYRAHFPLTIGRAARPRWITGEASPLYMFDPRAAARIARDLPDVKLIFLLREPAARAYSHYRHNVERGFEALEFAAALAAEPARLAGELEKILADPFHSSVAYGCYSYFEKGVYLPMLERYTQLFPRHQILVLPSTLLFKEPDVAWAKSLEFLGLDPAPLKDRRVRNASRDNSRSPVVDATLAALRARYAPHNAALEQRFGIRFHR